MRNERVRNLRHGDGRRRRIPGVSANLRADARRRHERDVELPLRFELASPELEQWRDRVGGIAFDDAQLALPPVRAGIRNREPHRRCAGQRGVHAGFERVKVGGGKLCSG